MRDTLTSLLCAATIGAAPVFQDLRQAPQQSLAALAPLTGTSDRAAWEKRRAELRQQWEQILGPMPQRVPLLPQVLSSEELPDHTRLLIRYWNDESSTNDAYLLLPKN